MTKKIFFYLFLVFFSACGVKGRPLPPLEPVPLGTGQPHYSKAVQDLQIKKKKQKKIQDDWEEPEDFIESEK